MGLQRKLYLFPFFRCQTMFFCSVSEFCMKNVFFWGTWWLCSSKSERYGRGLHKLQLQLWGPSNFLGFWATLRKCTPKEHIFDVEFRFKAKYKVLSLKNWKKRTFFVALFHVGVLCTKTLNANWSI